MDDLTGNNSEKISFNSALSDLSIKNSVIANQLLNLGNSSNISLISSAIDNQISKFDDLCFLKTNYKKLIKVSHP